MTIQRGALAAILILAFFAASGRPALADGITGFYVGGSVGVAKIAYDNSAFQKELQDGVAGFGTLEFTSAELHDRKTAWWANAGYMAWPFVGIDVSYLHLGELYNQVNGTFTPSDGSDTHFVGAATRVSSKGPALGLLFRLPLLDRFDLDLRIADYYARTTLTNIVNAASYETTVESANRSSLLAGLGLSFVFAGHWSARLDYLRVEHAGDSSTGKYNASMLSLGASYTF